MLNINKTKLHIFFNNTKNFDSIIKNFSHNDILRIYSFVFIYFKISSTIFLKILRILLMQKIDSNLL